MKKDPLNNAFLRTVQYWFEDGIVELVMGGASLMLGIYFYLGVVFKNSQLAEMLTASFVLIFIGGWYLAQASIRSLKERITFPRTGYVALRSNHGRRAVRYIAAAVLAMMMAGLLAFSQIILPVELNLLPAVTGLVIAIVLGLMGFQTALPRFYALAVISLVLGAALAPVHLSNDLATSAYYAGMGAVLLGSGGAILRSYLRQNPVQREARDD